MSIIERVDAALEEWGKGLLHEAGSPEAVCIGLGYFPPWKAAELYDTYGLNPRDMLPELAKRNLRMDWLGFQYQMAKRGADVRGLIEEAKRFEGA